MTYAEFIHITSEGSGQEPSCLPHGEGTQPGGLRRGAGIHRTYMGGVERGERNLTLKSVERMAEKLGMEVRDSLG